MGGKQKHSEDLHQRPVKNEGVTMPSKAVLKMSLCQPSKALSTSTRGSQPFGSLVATVESV